MRSYPHMPAIDCRPPPAADGHRLHLQYPKGNSCGWPLPTRDDLILQPWARALGYVVEHPDGNWCNAACFDLSDRCIWFASDGWQARRLIDGAYHGPRRVYGQRTYSLFTALLREAPLLLEAA